MLTEHDTYIEFTPKINDCIGNGWTKKQHPSTNNNTIKLNEHEAYGDNPKINF